MTAKKNDTDPLEVGTVSEEEAAQARLERDEQLAEEFGAQGAKEPPAYEHKDVNTPGRGTDPDVPAHRQ